MEFAFLALVLIFLYICTFALYFLFVAFVSKDRRRFVRNGRYSTVNYYNNLVVVIYAHNAEKDVSALLEKLNRQKYILAPNIQNIIIIILCILLIVSIAFGFFMAIVCEWAAKEMDKRRRSKNH